MCFFVQGLYKDMRIALIFNLFVLLGAEAWSRRTAWEGEVEILGSYSATSCMSQSASPSLQCVSLTGTSTGMIPIEVQEQAGLPHMAEAFGQVVWRILLRRSPLAQRNLSSAATGINSDGWFFGRPILLAFLRLCRHHLGSIVFGSCASSAASEEASPNALLQPRYHGHRCVLACLGSSLRRG